MFRIEQNTNTSEERSAEFSALDEAREAAATWINAPLTEDMRGACPDEDGLVGIECWMPYIDPDHIPDGTVFIYRHDHQPHCNGG